MRAGTTTRAAATTLAVSLAALVAVTALVVTVVVRAEVGDAGPAGPGGPRTSRSMPDVKVTEAVASLAVLRDWDAARAAAWRAGDVGALRGLYLPGSRAGERDTAMLRQWAARGLVVRGMAMQVLAVELLARTDRRIVLLVTDRLARAVATRDEGRRPGTWDLPGDTVSTRRLAFRFAGAGWRLASAESRPPE